MLLSDIHFVLTLNVMEASLIFDSGRFSGVMLRYWCAVPSGAVAVPAGFDVNLETLNLALLIAVLTVTSICVMYIDVLLMVMVAVPLLAI